MLSSSARASASSRARGWTRLDRAQDFEDAGLIVPASMHPDEYSYVNDAVTDHAFEFSDDDDL